MQEYVIEVASGRQVSVERVRLELKKEEMSRVPNRRRKDKWRLVDEEIKRLERIALGGQ